MTVYKPEVRAKGSGSSGEPNRTRTKKGRAALVESIAGALVAKDEDLFFLCDQNGELPLKGRHGYGLYYHDCRFLNGYELSLAGKPLSRLISTAGAGFKIELELTNIDVRLAEGRTLPKEDLAVRWERVIDGGQLALHDEFTLRNFGMEEFSLPLTLAFAADFEDVFVVRGMPAKARGTARPPRWDGGRLVLAYDGSDGIWRTVTLHFDPAPVKTEGATAHFQIDVAPREEKKLAVTLVLTESKSHEEPPPAVGPASRAGPVRLGSPDLPPDHDRRRAEESLQQKARQKIDRQTECRTGNPLFDRVLQRSLLDLHMLHARLEGFEYIAAGVPWYVTLFGRDSIIAALESLAFDPDAAEQTLRLLARFQGTKVDDWRDEQPGKILHELRVGELAHDDEIPQTPYYGTVDATPLFLVLLGLHAHWSGSLHVFHDLRGNVDRALSWINEHGHPDGGPFVAYQSKSAKGLSNQGWKDSGDAICNADGSLAKPPIALAEVQGYVYLAKMLTADLFRRAGDAARAEALTKQAGELRERFNRDFWMEDKGIYAMALQAGGRPVDSVASNAGQALWSGIADDDKAKRTAERLTADDMFSGWGVRTLSEKNGRYNPIAYHLGSVWPHDNALIVAGLRRCGCDAAAARVCSGILDAAGHYPMYRLPELFAGLRRKAFGLPVHYPVACHPQAWAAGATPYMLTALLGLTPEGLDGRLRVVRPMLPDGCDHVELRGLRIGEARVDLRFTREKSEKVGVEVLKQQGRLEVVTEP